MATKLSRRIRAIAFLMLLGAGSSFAATVIAIDGSAGIAGLPGSAVGWGFNVTSDPGVFALFTGSQFIPDTNSVGTYADYLSSSFFFGLPAATVTNTFNAATLSGAGEFDISPSAILGASILGGLQIFWDEYSVSPDDPSFDPQADLISLGNSQTLSVTVTVGDEPIAVATPEPSTLWLGLTGVVFLAWRSKNKKPLWMIPIVFGLLASSANAFQSIPVTKPTSDEQKALDILRYPLGPNGVLFGDTFKFEGFSIPLKGPYCHPDADPSIPGTDPSIITGCCGGPGMVPCVAPVPVNFPPFVIPVPYGTNKDSGFYCTLPSSNKPQIDPYDHGLYCNLAKPECDGAISDTINVASAFKLNHDPQSTTFYFTSDIHYYRNGDWAPENTLRHITEMNNSPGSPFTPSFFWVYGASRTVPDPIGRPLGLIIGGDVGTDASSGNLGSFRLMYEARGDVAAGVQFPVFFGLGNHETNTQTDAAGAHRMYDYLKNRMGNCQGVRQDDLTGNYSWDWGRLHLVMLNTWADDTTGKYTKNVTGHGLAWLANDLQNSVADSGRPVVLFQHYEFNASSDGWSQEEAKNFLNVIKDYNIAGIFAGHTHIPSVNRVDGTIWANNNLGPLLDSAGNEKVIDVFTNGTGGDKGKGDFIAIRYSDGGSKDSSYLDVQSMAWTVDQPTLLPQLQSTASGQNVNYYGGLAGCRKRLNTRYNDISSGSAGLGTLTTSLDTSLFPNGVLNVTLRNRNGSIPIPSQLAIQFRGSGEFVGNGDFVDYCGAAGGTSHVPDSSYVLLTDAQVAALSAPNGSTQVQLLLRPFSNSQVGPADHVALVALTPLWGSDSFSLDPAIPGTPDGKFPTTFPQSFTVYGPPGTQFGLICEYYNPPNPIGPQQRQSWASLISTTSVLNLLSMTPLPTPSPTATAVPCDGSTVIATRTFDITGRALIQLNVDANQDHIVNNDLPKITFKIHTALNPFSTTIAATLMPHLEAAVTIGMTIDPPSPHNPSSGPILFTATLYDTKGVTPPAIPDTGGHGGIHTPDGTLTLSEARLDAAGNVLSTTAITKAFVGSSGRGDCQELFGDSVSGGRFPSNTAQVVFGDTGGNSPHFCPSLDATFAGRVVWHSNSLAAGLHHFVVQYDGDHQFAPTQSAVFDYVVDAISSLTASSGAQQSTPAGTPFAQPLVAHVGAPAPGIAVTFTAPSGGASGFFAGNVTTATAFTDPSGNATSPVFNANSIPGSYLVTATLPTVPTPALSASFAMTNTATTAAPLLTASITSKTGALNARSWSVNVSNTQGPATGVTVSAIAFHQVAGTACSPLVQTPLPVTPGNGVIASGGAASASLAIDFSACAASARFTVDITVQANGGLYQRTTTIGNQFP